MTSQGTKRGGTLSWPVFVRPSAMVDTLDCPVADRVLSGSPLTLPVYFISSPNPMFIEEGHFLPSGLNSLVISLVHFKDNFISLLSLIILEALYRSFVFDVS